MLGRINQDVTELTVANRQLQTKCVLLENKHILNSDAARTMQYFLLVQKHTDLLLDYLVKQGAVQSLENYHSFIE